MPDSGRPIFAASYVVRARWCRPAVRLLLWCRETRPEPVNETPASATEDPVGTVAGRAAGGHQRPRPRLPARARRAAPGGPEHSRAFANNPIEAHHSRLQARLRPMRGLQRFRSLQTIGTGHDFMQNLRPGHYEIGTGQPVHARVRIAFDRLAQAV